MSTNVTTCVACGGHLTRCGRQLIGADLVTRGLHSNGSWNDIILESYPENRWFCGACELELRALIDQFIAQHTRTTSQPATAHLPAIPVVLTPQRLIEMLTTEEES